MPLNTFQNMGHSIGLSLTDSENEPIMPDNAMIKNILVFIVSKLTGNVVAQFSRLSLTDFDQADITTEPGVYLMYLNDANTLDETTGYYECEVHLQVFDSNFANGYRTIIQKCNLLNLKSSHHA